ncbi:23S rRNA pseudouridine(1911/1915/1917) synthase RluD [Accumulibacter sp.]|uniref:23S rRNA pseudouridine(1911/1915/1917) synthase RluD n=1 Tax=Accumulibacter sp. TaxID=2053492 RepID=UPI002606B948|nr:23S rRNA pseudouridine(1911/1915/1917) synthase RluD [Accumulibacter sp.]
MKDGGSRDYSANPGIALSVPVDCGGQRLDQVLARLLTQHSRSRLQDWIRQGRVVVGGIRTVEPRHRLWGGEAIEIAEASDARAESSAPEDIPLRIVYEDDSLIVIDKPVGLVVHPGNGNWTGTLLNALLHHAPQLAEVPRAGIVHRLDKDTSGLMVVAKALEAHTDLVRQLQARTVRRCYQALVRGGVDRAGVVDAPIGRHPGVRTKMAVVHNGKPARTHYRVLERFVDCTLIECALETGRTHQIRVHMASIGHPLIGDPIYGGAGHVARGPLFSRQALHAWRLALLHPELGRAMQWRSDLPADMAALLHASRLESLSAQDMDGVDGERNEEEFWDEDGRSSILHVDVEEPEDDDPGEQ